MNRESEQWTQASTRTSTDMLRSVWAERKWWLRNWSKRAIGNWTSVVWKRVKRERPRYSLGAGGTKNSSLSRAKSHIFNQLPSWLEATACTNFWDGWEAALDRSSERSSCRISFFIDGREMSSEDVSVVDVKLELRADSRKRHCRMNAPLQCACAWFCSVTEQTSDVNQGMILWIEEAIEV